MPSHYGGMKHSKMHRCPGSKKSKVAKARKAIMKNLMKRGTSKERAMAAAKKMIKG